ncbi:hypothetical protein SAY86_021889 [Trapa natans]|uniref:Uncharacterized protein n=1 Tax=Trapa natans TaxID=22666 RepID=A0AAN7MAQ6_TRANT|nr:hypothetical protein SAY86_021889 [Trapa natans]
MDRCNDFQLCYPLYFAPPHRVTRAKGFPFELSRRPRRRAPIKLENAIQLSYQVLAVTVLAEILDSEPCSGSSGSIIDELSSSMVFSVDRIHEEDRPTSESMRRRRQFLEVLLLSDSARKGCRR